MILQPQIRDYKKYVSQLKAIDDAGQGETQDQNIYTIVDDMVIDNYTIKEIYHFLIENYDDHHIPRILEMLYGETGGDVYERRYPNYIIPLAFYEKKIKLVHPIKRNYFKGMAEIVEEMAVYYSMSEIYEFLVEMDEKYDYIYIGGLLLHLYELGYY